MTTLETLQRNVETIATRFGIPLRTEREAIPLETRKALSAELTKLRDERDAESRRQLADLQKANDDLAAAIVKLNVIGQRITDADRAMSFGQMVFERKQAAIAERLRRSASEVIDGFVGRIHEEMATLNRKYWMPKTATQATTASFEARFEALGKLGTVVSAWHESTESDAALEARFTKELSKIPAFDVSATPAEKPAPLTLAERWHLNPHSMARAGEN